VKSLCFVQIFQHRFLVYSGEDLLVVALVVSLLEEDEVVLEHDVLAEHHGQELVVGNVLVDGRHDVSRFLQHEERDCGSEININCLNINPAFYFYNIPLFWTSGIFFPISTPPSSPKCISTQGFLFSA
jgi:hypothetical protein